LRQRTFLEGRASELLRRKEKGRRERKKRKDKHCQGKH